MVSEKNRERAKKLTDGIYTIYGSHTGVLFGLPSQYRSTVETIVGVVLELLPEEGDER